MHCGQSRISRIENAKDRNLSLGDILDYAGALGLNVELSLMPEDPMCNLVNLNLYSYFVCNEFDQETGKSD